MVPAHSDRFTEGLSSIIVLVHTYLIIMLKQRWSCVSLIITKIKKYEI